MPGSIGQYPKPSCKSYDLNMDAAAEELKQALDGQSILHRNNGDVFHELLQVGGNAA